jgi:group I intron endonuclease
MLKDLLNKVIIYMWFNKITGKVYIGSSSNGSKRLSTYYQPTTLKKRSRIYKNILKYGHSNFSVSILEICGDSNTVNKSHYLAREQFYLDWALKTYGLDVLNILTEANSSLGYKHEKETKVYLSESRKGKNNPMFGKAKSEAFLFQQTKDKSGANNPMFGKSKSEETLTKLRKMIFVYDVTDNNKLLGVYPTVVCTRTFNIGYETLSKRLLDGKIHKGKYLFSRDAQDK